MSGLMVLEQSVKAAWESVSDRWPVSFEAFCELVNDWEIVPIQVDGKVAGAVLINGPEMHACVLPFARKRWFTRRFHRLIDGIIEKHGYAQTHASTELGRQFIERLGFVRYGESYRKDKKWESKQS